jgi:hypothetical protein
LALTRGYGSFGFWGDSSSTYLFPYGPAPDDGSQLVLVPADEALRPDAGRPVSIAFRGAVETVVDGEEMLLAPEEGFTVVLDGPPRTLAVIADGQVRADVELGDEPVSIDVAPRRNRGDQNIDFARTFVAVTPSGRAQIETWRGTFVAEGPEVTLFADTDAFELQSRVYGRVSDGASVTVDGNPAEINANGAYSVHVDAPIWPRDIVVVARDVLGNEATQRLQVVGFLDYRGLPWAAIIGLATVAAGAFLFIRTPQRRERPVMSWEDGTLEEVEGDAR